VTNPPPSLSSALGQSELALRVVSAVALGLLALASAYVGGVFFAIVWGVGGAAVAFEWLTIVRASAQFALRIVLAASVFLVALVTLFWSVGAALALTAVAALGAALSTSGRERLWAACGIAYAAVLAIAPVLVREHPHWALGGILWMFAVVWATDVAGYFAGRGIGGPKLWPQVSPKKTWSGFIGGVLAGIGAGYAVALAFWGGDNGGRIIAAGAIASVAAQIGDLGESAFKRRWGVKDSSHLIPGHGGFMDRLDGFWAVSLLAGLGLLTRAALTAE
jgi:phosphatidate cytidylyltransferase